MARIRQFPSDRWEIDEICHSCFYKLMNPVKQKILLLLFAGISLGFTYSPNGQYRILKKLSREWKKINREKLRDDIRTLYKSHLVDIKENIDGSLTYTLTDKGKLKTLTYHFQNMGINKNKWDGKWRLVVFDIPEKMKNARNAIREKIKELGFYELQKSVFVFPYSCKDEIDFVIEFFNLRKFVRFGILDFIDNEIHLKEIFKLA